MKPRVVILSAFLSPFRSGAEACAEEVALRLADQFEITIVTACLQRSLPAEDPLRGRVQVVRVGMGCVLDKWLYPFLASLAVRRLRPQVVHAVLESYAGLAMMLVRLLLPSAKTLLTCQSTNTSFLVGTMHRRADRVTVISRALLDRAKRFGRVDATLLPNGVDFPAIRATCERFPKVPGRVLFVGRLRRMKGVDILLRAFSRLDFPQASLQIVGDGAERRSLETLVQQLKIGDHVSFVGQVPSSHVASVFAEAEVFCGLSRSEALGNVFLEAQAAGCAVIATRVGGIPDIVEDGKTGLLVPPEDIDAAAKALTLLLRDPAKRRELAEAGRGHAEAFDWSGIAGRYAEIYHGLL